MKIEQVKGSITVSFEVSNSKELERIIALLGELDSKHHVSDSHLKTSRMSEGHTSLLDTPRKNAQPSREDTYKMVLASLSERFPKGEFYRSDMNRIVLKQLDYRPSTISEALKYAVAKRLIYRVKPGVYSFEEPKAPASNFKIDPNNAIELICKHTKELVQTLRVIERVSPALILWISRDGIQGRTSDIDKSCMVDLSLAPSVFDSYHVREPLSFGIDVKSFSERLTTAKDKKDVLHLVLDNIQDNSIRVGAIGREFAFKVPDISTSPEPVEAVVLPSAWSEINIKAQHLEAILADAAVNAPYIDLIHEGNKTLITNVSEKGDFKREVESKCSGAISRSRFSIDKLLRIVKSIQSSTLVLHDYGDVITVQIDVASGISLKVMLACSRESVAAEVNPIKQ